MYAPSDCFETFPFPDFESNPEIEHNGRMYYECRASIMQKHGRGLTALYNQFHDPNSDWPEIPVLREFHDEMDRAVLESYGWSDLQPRCEFVPEFDGDDEEGTGSPHRKKYRYRWPDDFRDEVLARLLELNRARAEEEAHSAPAIPVTKATGKRGGKPGKSAPVASPSLFDIQEPTE
jgi:hypothetical protein